MTVADECPGEWTTADIPIGPGLRWFEQRQIDGIALDQVLAQLIDGGLMGVVDRGIALLVEIKEIERDRAVEEPVASIYALDAGPVEPAESVSGPMLVMAHHNAVVG